jgi:hypothetical protein
MLLAREPIEDPDSDERHQAQDKHEEFAAGAGLVAGGRRLGARGWLWRVVGLRLAFEIHDVCGRQKLKP